MLYSVKLRYVRLGLLCLFSGPGSEVIQFIDHFLSSIVPFSISALVLMSQPDRGVTTPPSLTLLAY